MYKRKQFILTKNGFVPKDFMSIQLMDGYTLAYHRDLPVTITNNKQIVILGYAWQTNCRCSEPKIEIEELSHTAEYFNDDLENKILEIEKNWCGEYVIIAYGRVYTDAVSMRCVYYTIDAVAGCMKLLLDHEGRNVKDCLDRSLILQGHGETFAYFPGPHTNIDGVKRLLPSQVLDYHEGSLHSRVLLTDDFSNLKLEEISEKFIGIFKYSMQQMRKTVPGTFWLALTGGHDSRTALALLSSAGVDFNCVTFERALWTVYGVEDYYLPPLLASKTGKRHLLLSKKKAAYDENRRNDFFEATICNVTGNAVDDYAYGQYDEVKAYSNGDAVWIGSAIWEIYEEFYKIGETLFRTGNESIEDFLEVNKKRITSAGMRDSLVEYFAWVDSNPQRGIGKVDRFYWEQGCAVWNAPYDQAKEMVEGFTTVQPLNCRILLNLLFSLPEEMRYRRKFEEYLTVKLCPQFEDIGYSGISNDKFLYFPYYLFEIGDNVVIYGAGRLGEQFLKRIQHDGLLAVSAVVDRNANKIKMCSGMPVLEPQVLSHMDFDVVMITIMNSTEARRVKKQLIEMGISSLKIKSILPLLGD